MKGTLGHFVTESRDKVLEAESDLEGGVAVHEGLEKTFTLCFKLYNEKKAKAVQTTIDSSIFFMKKTLYFPVSLIFSVVECYINISFTIFFYFLMHYN